MRTLKVDAAERLFIGQEVMAVYDCILNYAQVTGIKARVRAPYR